MKTNGIIITLRSIVSILLLLAGSGLLAQPKYVFDNGKLKSGTDNQVGAVYLFKNVAPGVDANVTITDLTNGLTLSSVDGGGGFSQALQPIINIPAHSDGYAEFKVDFIKPGTGTPLVQTEVPATPVDVDGQIYASGNLYEYDMLYAGPSSYVDYSLLGLALSVTRSGTWVTGKNLLAIDFPGVDTIAQSLMFTVVNANISSFTFRSGADNHSNQTQQRLRSVYFGKFDFIDSYILATPALLSFRGNVADKKVQLQWNLDKSNQLDNISIEKSTNASQFQSIGQVWTDVEKSAEQTDFRFSDDAASQGTVYYRLKMTAVNGQTSYSNVLSFKMGKDDTNPFRVYPSIINSSATVNVSVEKANAASFQLVDYSGRVVYNQQLQLADGNNNISVSGLHGLPVGNYIAVLRTSDKVFNQKVIMQ